MSNKLEMIAAKLNRMIDEASRVVFFGGAGVSTESGVPDFRGEHGIYKKHIGAETILTPDFMRMQEEEFWAFYRKFLILENIEPNPAHYFLAELEKEGKLTAVITQNIDSLHQRAGSRTVIELHGDGTRFYCQECGKTYEMEDVKNMELIPRCTCGGRIRPDVVLYQEALDGEIIEAAVRAITDADLLIVGGTSLTVYPAAGLIRYQRSGKLVIVNRDATSGDRSADLVIKEPIGEVFSAVSGLRYQK